MAKEVEPHINEESGTVKRNVQRYLLILGLVISIAFVFGIYNAFQSDDEKELVTQTENEPENTNVANTTQDEIVDFNVQVNEEMRKIERNKKEEDESNALKQAREDFEKSKESYRPSTTNNTNESEYDQFKKQVVNSGKVRNLTDIERLAESKVKLSKEVEEFQLKEKRRALEARISNISFKEIKNQPVTQTSKRSASNGASVQERIARIRAKTEQANQLKDKLLAGNYNSPDQLDALTGDLASLGIKYNSPNSANVNTNSINYSRVPKQSKSKVVGANLEKAENLNLNGVKLPTGTAIKAVLSQTVMSDYANKPFKAQITQDVYDADYETILFPKGTIVDGRSVQVANVNEPIQARMGLTINWFVLPNGNRIDFSQSATALDSMGIGAIKDDVNYHAMAQFLGVLAYAVVSSETSSNTSSGFTGETNIKGDIGQGIREQFSPLASRYLSLTPTVTLNTGTPITIYIENEMHVEPWGTIYDDLL
ncbi:TrbI/VirB10 family protein [Pseudoalteromonas nigrifaciens]|uniref:TrbI/VirB10 family protein n=1 Tax=Pseudoalteromonas nigrifaciens TaxID=28109 RepID=UPI003FD534CB